MSTELIEREIAALKKRVKELETKTSSRRNPKWLQAAGALKDADLLDEAVRLGQEFRERANREGR
jgi:hypothetical protein